jgi:hypothetical protein
MSEEEIPTKPSGDATAAVAILVITLIIAVIGLYVYIRSQKGNGENGYFLQLLCSICILSHRIYSLGQAFTPPPEREAYVQGKERLDIHVASELEELKRLLMKRAIHTIPILMSLQNEGNSIERLYKRGMLTDNMHFHVKEMKAFVDKEFQDVQLEADDLVEGWGQQIWPQAMQFHQLIIKQAEEKLEDQGKFEEEKKKAKKVKRASKEIKENAAKEIVVEDPEVVKHREAERMAQLLLDEEEQERSKKVGSKPTGRK